jgi:hypothetical protein
LCEMCTLRGIALTTKMATLPPEISTINIPFKYISIDMAGPIIYKCNKLKGSRTIKGAHVMMTVCLLTRGTHIKLVESLEAKSITLALNAMMGRKGKPGVIYSHRGATFSQIAGHVKEGKNLVKYLEERGIELKLVPTGGHNLNGSAEAMIKIFKRHFERQLHNTKFTAVNLQQILAIIEGIMNNRPLYIDEHEKAVTPMNLMMGRDMVATENDENKLIEWSELTEIKTKQTIENFWN